METLESLTLARWTELLNSEFEIVPQPGASINAQLVSVTPGPAGKAGIGGGAYESFSLIFRSNSAPALRQGTYSFQNPGLGSLDMFMVPIGQNSLGTEYQVVINRLVKG